MREVELTKDRVRGMLGRKLICAALIMAASVTIYAADDDCLVCHDRTGAKAFEATVHINNDVILKSIHKDLLCTDCHDVVANEDHSMKLDVDCGSCHSEIQKIYETSVHGVASKRGIKESPTCFDCHGGHNVISHTDPSSTVYSTNVPKTCSECHTSEKIVGKFGLKADRIETFKESFHGIAVEFGEATAANCASCHGVHNIYDQKNPKSLIHSDNIEATCGACHDDLPDDFAHGTIHSSAKDKESGGKFFVRQFYIIFISILVLGFIIYRILEYKRRVKRVE